MLLNIEVAVAKVNELSLKDKKDKNKPLNPLDFKKYFEGIDASKFTLPIHNVKLYKLTDDIDFHGKRNVNLPKDQYGNFVLDGVNGRYLNGLEYLDDTKNIIPSDGQYIGFCPMNRNVFLDSLKGDGKGITDANKAEFTNKANEIMNEEELFNKVLEETIKYFL